MLPFVKDPAFFPTEYAGEYQSGLGPLTNNGADFLGWEKIPQSLRANFNSQTLKDLAQFPTDWPEIEVRVFKCQFQPNIVAIYTNAIRVPSSLLLLHIQATFPILA
jgi:hypothetical protein